MSDICYDRFNRAYRCYDNGIGYGARIGIGIGVAAAVVLLFALCGYWRRKQLQKQFSKYRPPALPYAQSGNAPAAGYTYGQGNNPYANNPPPPATNSSFAGGNPYGSNPPPPAATYQPSMAGQYGKEARTGTEANNINNGEHEHGYEWEQAREAERLEREGGGAAPPGYDVTTQTPVVTGTPQTSNHYAPPPGAPPTK